MVRRFTFVILILFLAVALLIVVFPVALSAGPLVVSAVLAVWAVVALSAVGCFRPWWGPLSPRSPPRA